MGSYHFIDVLICNLILILKTHMNFKTNKINQSPDYCGDIMASKHMGFSDFKDVVAFGNNQLWRPLVAKVQGLHSGLSQKNGQRRIPCNHNSDYMVIAHNVCWIMLYLNSE